ncbi:hypothetical protein FT641_19585 [Bacillus paranthracis]|uniref:hypothetical protein n=1 Tax=Bacillus paranthracis TaxID=2026186 RepID=UPI00187B0F91|nr:hypothetical protein [Bacillus paranthracis]MBE7114737.1 hypothetical protein [Bacillus paranthracis]MBE7154896.1 hypothetical protein [Bacillus paranthracis]
MVRKEDEKKVESTGKKKFSFKNIRFKKVMDNKRVFAISVALAVAVSVGIGTYISTKDSDAKIENKGYTKKDVVKAETAITKMDKSIDEVLAPTGDTKNKDTGKKNNKEDTKDADIEKSKVFVAVKAVNESDVKTVEAAAKTLEEAIDTLMPNLQSKGIDESSKKIKEFKEVNVAAKSILQEYHAIYKGLRDAEAEINAGGDKEKIHKTIEDVKYRLVSIKTIQRNYNNAKKEVEKVSKG